MAIPSSAAAPLVSQQPGARERLASIWQRARQALMSEAQKLANEIVKECKPRGVLNKWSPSLKYTSHDATRTRPQVHIEGWQKNPYAPPLTAAHFDRANTTLTEAYYPLEQIRMFEEPSAEHTSVMKIGPQRPTQEPLGPALRDLKDNNNKVLRELMGEREEDIENYQQCKQRKLNDITNQELKEKTEQTLKKGGLRLGFFRGDKAVDALQDMTFTRAQITRKLEPNAPKPIPELKPTYTSERQRGGLDVLEHLSPVLSALGS